MDLTALAASFIMIGDVLAHSGVSEAQLVLLARESARMRLEPVH